MEKTNHLNFIETYFRSRGHFSSTLLKGLLMFVIAQQIYWPQDLKYFHLAVLFTYIIFLDFFKDDHWAFYELNVFMTLILGCSLVSIAEKVFGVALSMAYLTLLMSSIGYTLLLIRRIYRALGSHKEADQFSLSTQAMLNRGTKFMKLLSIAIMTLLVATLLYSGYELIKLF